MTTDFTSWTGQYVLSAEQVSILGWNTHSVGSHYLASHPTLPVVPVTTGCTEAGVILGWPVSPKGRLIDRLAIGKGADPVAAAYAHGGRWLLITTDSVYPDPLASEPAVYSAEYGMVASSSGLLPAAYDEKLVETFDIVGSNRWYPFGLTPKRGVRRLLPNHRLNLNSYEAERHWLGPALGSTALDEAAAAVISAVQAVARAFADSGLLVGLTAGQDSRMLLAALRSHIDSVEFVTSITGKGGSNLVDVQVARALARRYGLVHSIAERRPATDAEKRGWLERTGWTCAGGRIEHMPDKRTRYAPGGRQGHVIQETEAQAKAFAHGLIGELARAYYWCESDRPDAPLTVEEAVARVKAPALPAVLAGADAWLASVPNEDRLRMLDLLYLEHRLGSRYSASLLGSSSTAPTLYPLNRRDVLDAFIGLGEDHKRSGAIIESVIQRSWPELLEIPFNQPTGLHRTTLRLRSGSRRVLGTLCRRLIPPRRRTR